MCEIDFGVLSFSFNRTELVNIKLLALKLVEGFCYTLYTEIDELLQDYYT
jgi:hypothetical protein